MQEKKLYEEARTILDEKKPKFSRPHNRNDFPSILREKLFEENPLKIRWHNLIIFQISSKI